MLVQSTTTETASNRHSNDEKQRLVSLLLVAYISAHCSCVEIHQIQKFCQKFRLEPYLARFARNDQMLELGQKLSACLVSRHWGQSCELAQEGPQCMEV